MRMGTSVVLFARKITTLPPTETWEAHHRNDLVLVDVRQRQEWRSGVVAGALLVQEQREASVRPHRS